MSSTTAHKNLIKAFRKHKGYLPKGYAATVASTLQISEKTVYNAINGVHANYDVLIALIKLAKSEKSKIEKALK